MEGLDPSEVKRPKLSDDADGPSLQGDLEADDTDDDTGADGGLGPGTTPEMSLDPSRVSSTDQHIGTESSPEKGKTVAKGADIHFKENPYTFISPSDPIIQGCMWVISMID